MSWTFTDDARCYAAAARPLLETRPAEHTIALTNLDNVLAGRTPGGDVFGWFRAGGREGGPVTGAVSQSPGRPLLVSELPPGSEDELAERYPGHGGALLGLVGEPDAAERLAAGWSARHGSVFQLTRRERLYRLDRLSTPDVPGVARLADRADADLVVSWFDEFIAEAETGPMPGPGPIIDRIERKLGWLWIDPAGEPASMAFRHSAASGVIRVGPVYTPKQHRRRGYAAAVTAACTADALGVGAREVVLFADLSNPTSNAIYQSIGYRPVSDRLALEVVA